MFPANLRRSFIATQDIKNTLQLRAFSAKLAEKARGLGLGMVSVKNADRMTQRQEKEHIHHAFFWFHGGLGREID